MQLATADGAFTAGRKAVGLGTDDALPPQTPQGRGTPAVKSRSTLAFPAATPKPDDPYYHLTYGWTDAQPRSTPGKPSTVTELESSVGSRAGGVATTPSESRNLPTQGARSDKKVVETKEKVTTEVGDDDQTGGTKKVKNDKFDKYYHQTLSCIQYIA